ncbi:hypothetical protein QM012_003791 [Aureobasidium pullulans]|uniref:RNA polymerase II subunit B1 CTD phosphatase RPAP2 homolog n=1 Tax=Aureobasidium pullulans TaxID=5580 RepID=A0ABR0T995_AURPU
MSTSQTQPKSILKKTSHTSSTLDSSSVSSLKITPKSDAERKRLETAIQHAHLIQEQKSILRQNLDYIEELSDYPQGTSASVSETSAFLEYMINFQPSDYDALIEERYVNGRCGYTLCANAPRKAVTKAPWMKSKGVENWCSEDCAKKALYIKAQLSETPAWERRAGDRNSLVLYSPKTSTTAPAQAGTQIQLPVREKPTTTTTTAAADQRDLAYERGEIDKVADAKMDKVLKAQVHENSIISSVMPPTQTKFADSSVHDLIEGYQPRGVQQGNRITIKSEDTDSDGEE